MMEGMNVSRIMLAAALALLAFSASAADPVRPPGNEAGVGQSAPVAAAPRLTTLDFFRHPQIGDARISPDGHYLALLVPQGEETRLDIVDTVTLRGTAAYNMGLGEFVGDFHWINNNTVVWEATKRYGELDKLYRTGNLMVARADKAEGKSLGDALLFLDRIRNSPDEILVSWDGKIYRENVRTNAIRTVAETPFKYAEVVADDSGTVRLATGRENEDVITEMWDDSGGRWKELARSNRWSGESKPLAFAADNRHVYVSSSLEAPTNGIYLVDTGTGERKLLFRDERVDWARLLMAPGTEEPSGVLYFPDYPAYHFFDENSATAKTYAELLAAFPNSQVNINSGSDDGKLAVVSVESDRQPKTLYLMDREKHSLRLLFKSMPWIDPQQMSEMSAFVIKARDGVELHGYLTLPRGGGEKNLPLIVMPHGGPHGMRDLWGYSPEVQYLAYHGYAVLQLNFRGSGGYGRTLESLGLGHWGTTMQDDLTDATRWAIQEGIADPARICISGASYGGYAALMGVVREPDLYRCAVSYVGVTDLTVEKRYSDTADSSEGRLYLKRALGMDADDLKARSPVYNVDRIKVPLFLVQGGRDLRVPVENFTLLTKALDRAHKPYETLVKKEEGHGFYSEANNVELYERMLGFFEKNIGAGVKPPQAAGAVAVSTPSP